MNHLQQVENWLEEHVYTCPNPETVMLRSFEVNWERVSGDFELTIDGNEVPGRFTFSLDMTGRISTGPPIFVSPLGAPCSYAAVELDDATWATIDKLIDACFPRFRPYGRERATGIEVDGRTPILERALDPSAFLHAQSMIDVGFSITSKVSDA